MENLIIPIIVIGIVLFTIGAVYMLLHLGPIGILLTLLCVIASFGLVRELTKK